MRELIQTVQGGRQNINSLRTEYHFHKRWLVFDKKDPANSSVFKCFSDYSEGSRYCLDNLDLQLGICELGYLLRLCSEVDPKVYLLGPVNPVIFSKHFTPLQSFRYFEIQYPGKKVSERHNHFPGACKAFNIAVNKGKIVSLVGYWNGHPLHEREVIIYKSYPANSRIDVFTFFDVCENQVFDLCYFERDNLRKNIKQVLDGRMHRVKKLGSGEILDFSFFVNLKEVRK